MLPDPGSSEALIRRSCSSKAKVRWGVCCGTLTGGAAERAVRPPFSRSARACCSALDEGGGLMRR